MIEQFFGGDPANSHGKDPTWQQQFAAVVDTCAPLRQCPPPSASTLGNG
jgi:hypothetical protein